MTLSATVVRRFEAMGCDVVVAGADDETLAAIRTLFERHEATFSRFRPGTELARINASDASLVAVSPRFARSLREALRAARATDGLVDPTVGAAVEAAGYDADFAALRPDPRPAAGPVPGRWHELRLSGGLLARPRGVRLDLNGVVKALTVDDALRLLPGDGFVSAGGDVAVRGGAVVALPAGGTVRVHAGGIATSGTAKRRWLRGGRLQHHLVDPRTGRPSTSRWAQVTAAAGSCLGADIAAKAAFLLDGDGPDWLDQRGLPGRFLDARGEIVVNAHWRQAVAAPEASA